MIQGFRKTSSAAHRLKLDSVGLDELPSSSASPASRVSDIAEIKPHNEVEVAPDTIRVEEMTRTNMFTDFLDTAIKTLTAKYQLDMDKRVTLREKLQLWLDQSLIKNPEFPPILVEKGFEIWGDRYAAEIKKEELERIEIQKIVTEYMDDLNGEIKTT